MSNAKFAQFTCGKVLDRIENMRSMEYSRKYKTPEGFDDLVMCGDDEALTGLWFEGSRDDRREAGGCEKRETLAGAEISG